MPDPVAASPSILDLLADGTVDAELAALLWILADADLPLTVVGPAALQDRARVARAVLALPPVRPWLLIDADAERPGLATLGARIRGGLRVGITLEALDLRTALEQLSAPPDGLPEDAVRRLGIVLVVGTLPTTHIGPIVDRQRVIAAHYLRPTERDPQGHIQRRPPAVLATWDAANDRFDHFAWGMTPELAMLVDRTQATFEELQASRATALRSLVANSPPGGSTDEATALAAVVASEPPRQSATRSSVTRPAAARSSLTDPHVH